MIGATKKYQIVMICGNYKGEKQCLQGSILVEIKCIKISVVTQLYFQIVKEETTCFGPFLGGPSSG
jgi:hypothetical protein